MKIQANSFSVISTVRHGECQKNQAAAIGGYATDGCREFMPSGEEGTDAALTCTACAIHMSFHQRWVETQVVGDGTSYSTEAIA